MVAAGEHLHGRVVMYNTILRIPYNTVCTDPIGAVVERWSLLVSTSAVAQRGRLRKSHGSLSHTVSTSHTNRSSPRESTASISSTWHQGNMQGTFSLSRAGAREPPSQLQKYLKKVSRLTQNTTCQHEYLRQGLTRPNNVSQEWNSVFTAYYHVARTIPQKKKKNGDVLRTGKEVGLCVCIFIGDASPQK
jgi:hypothetical protein